MKIALINPGNISEVQEMGKQNEPVSIQYLKSYLNQYSYVCDCYDFNIINNIESIIELIANTYDVVGISVFYPYNPLILADKIKDLNTKIVVFIGGPGAKLNYKKYLLENSPIEYVIFNEGEEKLKILIDYLDGKISITDLYGLAYRDDNKIIVKNKLVNLDINQINYPTRTKEEIENYLPSIVSSRGCNGKCIFCSNSYMGKWRGRNYLNVVDEIEYLNKDLSQKYFQFIEPNFLGDNEHGLRIANEIIDRNLNVSFDFACRVDSLINSKHVLKQLKKAGASRVLLGVENFYDATLLSWHKEISNKDILNVLALLKDIDLPVTISLILFHQYTTMDELIFNIDMIDTIKLEGKIDNLFNKMIFYPGTGLNRTNEIIEWEFKTEKIKNIYENCIIYNNNQERHRNNIVLYHEYLKTHENVDEYILKNLFYFENVKSKMFSFLKYNTKYHYRDEDKKHLTYQNYSGNRNILFKLNSLIDEREENENNYIFRNCDTGISYYINLSAYLIFNLVNNSTYYEFAEKVKYYLGNMNVKDYFYIISILFKFVYLDILVIEK